MVMMVFVLTFVVMVGFILAMSVGVLMGRKPIAGSCGGMAALGMETECDICRGNPEICETEQQKSKAEQSGAAKNVADLSYDASEKQK
jgi:hypothetical protein